MAASPGPSWRLYVDEPGEVRTAPAVRRRRPRRAHATREENAMPALVYAIIVVLDYTRTIAGLIAYAQLVVQKMTGNANFPNAAQIVTAVSNAITAYQGAVSSTKTQKGLKG